ncbi:HAD-IIA family hydrolase [Streptomyces tanashiensis]
MLLRRGWCRAPIREKRNTQADILVTLTDMDRQSVIHEGVPIARRRRAFDQEAAARDRQPVPGPPSPTTTIYNGPRPAVRPGPRPDLGLELPVENIWTTAALATAKFLDAPAPGQGDRDVDRRGGPHHRPPPTLGHVLTDHDPAHVVLGETPYVAFEATTNGRPPHPTSGARIIGT